MLLVHEETPLAAACLVPEERLLMSALAARGQRLREVGDQVIGMLDADG